MNKVVQVRNMASGRTDEFAVEVVSGDASRVPLVLADSAEAVTGTDTNKIISAAALASAVSSSVPAASTTVAGKVELATSAEAITGTDTARAVTPKALADAATTHVAAASTDAAGKVELATSAETIAVTDQARAVTPYGLGAALAKLYAISFTGKNGAGACTATGAAVGDVIYSVAGLTDMGLADASFEGAVTVVNEIQQTAVGDLSTKNFLALIYRPA